MKKAPTHKSNKRKDYARRKPKVGWYNTVRWKRLRKYQLIREPLCRECLKQKPPIVMQAYVADHIKPHKGDYDLFYDIENLQSLCTPCHNSKTAKQDGGFGRC